MPIIVRYMGVIYASHPVSIPFFFRNFFIFALTSEITGARRFFSFSSEYCRLPVLSLQATLIGENLRAISCGFAQYIFFLSLVHQQLNEEMGEMNPKHLLSLLSQTRTTDQVPDRIHQGFTAIRTN